MNGPLREEAKKRLRYIDEIEEWLEPLVSDPEIYAAATEEDEFEATEEDEFEAPNIKEAFDVIREALRLLL